MDASIKDGVAKFGGKVPPKGALKLPLQDGDAERDDEAYKGVTLTCSDVATARTVAQRTYGGMYYPYAKRVSEALQKADETMWDYEYRL